MQTEARLPAGPDFSILKGGTGNLIVRPWFDAIAVRAVMNWFLPLSRAWAAGVLAQGNPDRFVSATGLNQRAADKIAPALAQLESVRRRYDDAETRWEAAFFDNGQAPEPLRIDRATARFHAATNFMTLRRKFLPLRRRFPQVAWSVATPAEVLATQGKRLKDTASAYAAPSIPSIELSKFAPGQYGQEGWLRMPSPSAATGDTTYAHVFWPEGKVRGTVVSLHGVLMEQDMWPIADPVGQMVEDGFCVIRPEGPWHGRRCPVGQYGGEAIFANGIRGFLELFEAWVAEVALWIHWARAENGGRVGLAGISLGALTAQLVAANCGHWPRDMRPDAVLLITTTGDMADGALQGSLAGMLDMRRRLSEAGWREDQINLWRPLLEPGDTPAMDPNLIAMVLGDADTITPYPGGQRLAANWRIPPENLFVSHQGHFSAALGLYGNRAPLDRLAAILRP